MEQVVQFQVAGDNRLLEIRVALDPDPDPGQGGTIDPGELGIIGDTIRKVGGTLTPDLRIGLKVERPVAFLRVDGDQLLDALRQNVEFGSLHAADFDSFGIQAAFGDE